MGSTRLNEFALIARYFVPLAAGEEGAFALSDDAALITLDSGQSMVVTTDTVVAGVHFLPSDPPESVAAKALAVNLSDLAAMGARPRAYTLSLALPSNWCDEELESWIAAFSHRLAEDQAKSGITLIGGDTVAIPGPLCLTVTAFGAVNRGSELRRSAAKPGDVVYVSGTIGDAALGLRVIAGDLPGLVANLGGELAERYRFPRARTELGAKLVGVVHGVADVSDGLVADVGHICVASGVSATIDAHRVPLSLSARAAIATHPDLFAAALTGGDDYELVFTAPPSAKSAIEAISESVRLPLTAIGRVEKSSLKGAETRVRVAGADGRPLDLGMPGYQHF